jgi:curli biogenesis system outer membrane secretion channel CsgG
VKTCVLAFMGLAAALVCACSDEPPAFSERSHQKTVPVAAAPVAPVATNPTGAAPAPRHIVLEDKTLTNDEVRQLLAQHYKPVSRHGEIYYCRREEHLGSRFAAMTCRTAEQMKALTQQSKDMLATQQKTSGCTAQGPAC